MRDERQLASSSGERARPTPGRHLGMRSRTPPLTRNLSTSLAPVGAGLEREPTGDSVGRYRAMSV